MDSDLIKTFTKGTYFNPANRHYGGQGQVNCDRCGMTNIKVCVGYCDTDLCMRCVYIMNSMDIFDPVPIKPFKPIMVPPSPVPSFDKKSPYLSRMMQHMHKPNLPDSSDSHDSPNFLESNKLNKSNQSNQTKNNEPLTLMNQNIFNKNDNNNNMNKYISDRQLNNPNNQNNQIRQSNNFRLSDQNNLTFMEQDIFKYDKNK